MSRWRAGVGHGTIRAVWLGAHRLCRQAFRDAQVCWWWPGLWRGCHGVVTSGAKHGGTQGDTLRRFVQVGGREGRAGTGEYGFSLTGGQVVAGSNPVSPTTFRQLKCYFYLLPKAATPEHLIRCQLRTAIAVFLPGTKSTLTCGLCPKSDARIAATSSRRFVTRTSVDGGRASRSHP